MDEIIITVRNRIFEDPNIYADDYYDSIDRAASVRAASNLNQEYGTPSTALRGATTLLIKVGYILIQTACIPTWNVYSLIYFNLVDFVSATLGYLCIGYFLSFGNLKQTIFADKPDYDAAVLGWCASIFTSTLVTVLLAGRLTKTAFFIITTILNWLITPLFFFFIYSDDGLMHKQAFMGEVVSLKDYGGSLIIHTIGSLIGLIGILFLGRRVMRLKEIYECSMGPDAPGLAVTGYFFVMVGMLLLDIPSRAYEQTHTPKDYAGLIIVNNILAAVGSMTMVIIFGIYYKTFVSYWYLLRIIQAGLAGMVMVSAGQDVFRPIASLGTSVFAGILFYWIAQFSYFSVYEDYCNIVAIHLIPGIIGLILPGIYSSTDNMGFGTVDFKIAIAHLLWQIICLSATLVIVIIIFSAVFFLLRYCGILRNSVEEIQHKRALIILKRTTHRKFSQRIFPPKPTSIVLLPGYESKQIFKNERLETLHELNVKFKPNNEYFSMFAKTMIKNPFQKEFEETSSRKLVNSYDNPEVIHKTPDSELGSQRTKFTTSKSSSEPLLDIQPSIITHRRYSTMGNLDKSLHTEHKFIQRPWNIYQKVRLYGLKRTEKRCNITLGNIEKYHTMEPIIDNDNYLEVINLKDKTVKIIKSPINIDDNYESISESEM